MKTLERQYSKNERIIARARFSAWIYYKSVLITLLLGGIVAVVYLFGGKVETMITKADTVKYMTEAVSKYVLLGACVLALLSFIVQALNLYSKELIVTESKVVIRNGLLKVSTIIIPIDKIILVKTKQNFLQRIVGVGGAVIMSDAVEDEKHSEVVVKGIKSVDRLTRRILKQVEIVQNERDARRMKLELDSMVPSGRPKTFS